MNKYIPLVTTSKNRPICYQIVSMTTNTKFNVAIFPDVWLGNHY